MWLTLPMWSACSRYGSVCTRYQVDRHTSGRHCNGAMLSGHHPAGGVLATLQCKRIILPTPQRHWSLQLLPAA
jgi:hypothetical protein